LPYRVLFLVKYHLEAGESMPTQSLRTALLCHLPDSIGLLRAAATSESSGEVDLP
jgi:hypothetical protein